METTPSKDMDATSNHSIATDRSSTPEMDLWSESEESNAATTPEELKSASQPQEKTSAATELAEYDSDDDLNSYHSVVKSRDNQPVSYTNDANCDKEVKSNIHNTVIAADSMIKANDSIQYDSDVTDFEENSSLD